MDDLIAFLRARLDEDEQTARAAKPGPWHTDGGDVHATHPTDRVVDYTESADHIARHDPARVLAEVDAKRRIVELHGPAEFEYSDVDVCSTCDRGGPLPYPCPTLRLLALPYARPPRLLPGVDAVNVEGLLHLLAAEPTLLPAAPADALGDEIEARRSSGRHVCLRCGQPATTALIAEIPDHGKRWLDLCMAHFMDVRRAERPNEQDAWRP